ncbi:hypothetical protein EVAR_87547_1 [Eumeta japonica]|uniref:Uncharacterized protein n=1 Tax=Eumeta variegata TaxID=151549 RepID=A0A4C1XP15_EUMVA|nr:hypothetical protein EVAR_87547_1 [Eumeta japonica]
MSAPSKASATAATSFPLSEHCAGDMSRTPSPSGPEPGRASDCSAGSISRAAARALRRALIDALNLSAPSAGPPRAAPRAPPAPQGTAATLYY